ncbi:type II toxin-antitoxin system PemK/MazF family toxin [Xanthobacteraceae bacterium A53D]
MPIQYLPTPASIILCDFSRGFEIPEMVKKRPAVVISPRLPRRDNLCAVVGLSGTEPSHAVPYQCRIQLDEPLPPPFSHAVWWVKADMVVTVGLKRLDLFRTERDQFGKRKFLTPKIKPEDFARIQTCVLHGLGFSHLTGLLAKPN